MSPESSITEPAADREAVEGAVQLMASFAERTGLGSPRPQRRYLWTDAFAVCNELALAARTGSAEHRERARRLIELVHVTLGRHRPDDARRGWLSGLDEDAGRLHPTRGGLRIGKPLPERGPTEPLDERLEWDRDGQYFHYLTKWMLALDQAARACAEPRYNLWARELAERAYAAFVYPAGGGRRRMVWKMSVDLSRPLVPSMGQHDPLDGLVTCMQLRATARRLGTGAEGPSLEQELAGLRAMSGPEQWLTTDPLGVGGLLMDAARVAQLPSGAAQDQRLVGALLAIAAEGVRGWVRSGDLHRPAEERLAFRELGLAIGLQAVALVSRIDDDGRAALDALEAARPLARALGHYWLAPERRRTATWRAHQDINDVMLATTLVPEGALVLG